MAFLKDMMVFCAIVAVFAGQAQVKAGRVQSLCKELKDEIAGLKDGEEIFARAKEFITENTEPDSQDRDLIGAWDNIYHAQDCASSSWEDLFDLNLCQYMLDLELLEQPIRSYTEKCFSHDYASKVIVEEANNPGAEQVEFVDSEFIKKFYEDNPNELPLYVFHIESIPTENRESLGCCKAEKASGAVLDAIKRDFSKQGKDPATEFKNNQASLSKYLDDKLFEPCESVSDYYKPAAAQLAMIATHYEGGQRALIKSLGQEAKEVLFRFKFCDMSEEDKKALADKVGQMFV